MASSTEPRVGLALGGGGAVGVGHIPVFEAFDDLGVRPAAIAGSSIGSVMGAAYAAGLSGAEIRAHAEALTENKLSSIFKAWRPGTTIAGGGIDPVRVVSALLPEAVPDRIEDLTIPFSITVTDYHGRAPIYVREGPLRQTLAASIAVPGVFRTVMLDGVVCTDGGVTDNLPLGALPTVDVTVAVDVATAPIEISDDAPNQMVAGLGAMRIMMERLAANTIERTPPDVLIRVRSRHYTLFDIWKAERILADVSKVRGEARDRLAAVLG
ncbi:MAG: patatin-like phospholipase family protein [Pseudomonadota bacterium]